MVIKSKLYAAVAALTLCFGLTAMTAAPAQANTLSDSEYLTTSSIGFRRGSNVCTHSYSTFWVPGYSETVWFQSHWNSGGKHYHRIRVVYTTVATWTPLRQSTNTVYLTVQC